jgi:class 3 adenylate cyclase
MSPDALSRAARVAGAATRSAATNWVDLFMESIGLTPEQRATMSLDTLVPVLFEPATRVARVIEPLIVWLLRRHQEQALNALNVVSMEEALEAMGLRPAHGAHVPAMLFADISGYTQLTEERGDETAVRSASILAELAIATAAEHDGRLVKQLGDGVMLVFRGIVPAAQAALVLRHRGTDAGLPPLHVGIAAGPMVERDGDFFGRTVNLASRLSDAAGPNEILLNDAVDLTPAHETVPLGAIGLKGMTTPVAAYRLEQSSAS